MKQSWLGFALSSFLEVMGEQQGVLGAKRVVILDEWADCAPDESEEKLTTTASVVLGWPKAESVSDGDSTIWVFPPLLRGPAQPLVSASSARLEFIGHPKVL